MHRAAIRTSAAERATGAGRIPARPQPMHRPAAATPMAMMRSCAAPHQRPARRLRTSTCRPGLAGDGYGARSPHRPALQLPTAPGQARHTSERRCSLATSGYLAQDGRRKPGRCEGHCPLWRSAKRSQARHAGRQVGCEHTAADEANESGHGETHPRPRDVVRWSLRDGSCRCADGGKDQHPRLRDLQRHSCRSTRRRRARRGRCICHGSPASFFVVCGCPCRDDYCGD